MNTILERIATALETIATALANGNSSGKPGMTASDISGFVCELGASTSGYDAVVRSHNSEDFVRSVYVDNAKLVFDTKSPVEN